ncbi:CbrC family protein [Streptomyces actinomycinicus]|uniref:CbrC family protein n=1 Tax=Streptomyces actinomycinicus TaxID=1695166 RepID=A0A937ESB2_9ACTN|nr:CbrC family protein [Streptomyces actinomycinicus]MBL1087662.1 CbrC family protein [Streptomyces actinomycinicus]
MLVSVAQRRRTRRCRPGFHAWQDPHRQLHCQDAAAFVAEVGYTEPAAHPKPSTRCGLMRLARWHDQNRLEHFPTHLGEGATAMLFRCTVCGAHLACAVAS